jgi:hypothetical protein
MAKKSKKKGAAPKPKGSTWERMVAQKLTDRTGLEFRRVPGSGAWMGGQNREKNINVLSGAQEALSGDIMGPDGWPFSIECKNTAAFPRFHLMLENQDVQIDGFLLEAMTDAYHVKKIPLLALKRTRRGEFMMIPRYLALKAVEFDLPPPESYPHMTYIFKRPEETIPVHHLWTLLSFDFFVYNAAIFWEAGIATLTETGELEECSEKN